MHGEEKSLWTTVGTDILVHVADPNLLGLKLWNCCCIIDSPFFM